jgi:hypothetical protein
MLLRRQKDRQSVRVGEIDRKRVRQTEKEIVKDWDRLTVKETGRNFEKMKTDRGQRRQE